MSFAYSACGGFVPCVYSPVAYAPIPYPSIPYAAPMHPGPYTAGHGGVMSAPSPVVPPPKPPPGNPPTSPATASRVQPAQPQDLSQLLQLANPQHATGGQLTIDLHGATLAWPPTAACPAVFQITRSALCICNGTLQLPPQMKLWVAASWVRLQHITIKGPGLPGTPNLPSSLITMGAGGHLTMEECTIQLAEDGGVHTSGLTLISLPGSPAQARLDSCTISSCSGDGVCAVGLGSTAHLHKCVSSGHDGCGYRAVGGGALSITESCARDCASAGFCAQGAGSKLSTGPGCVSENNQVGFLAQDKGQLTAGPRNTAMRCAENGFEAAGSSCMTVGWSSASESNGGNGYLACGNSAMQVQDSCVARKNQQNGYAADGSISTMQLTNFCAASHNGMSGLLSKAGAYLGAGNECTASCNQSHGLAAEGAASRVVVGPGCSTLSNSHMCFSAAGGGKLTVESCGNEELLVEAVGLGSRVRIGHKVWEGSAGSRQPSASHSTSSSGSSGSSSGSNDSSGGSSGSIDSRSSGGSSCDGTTQPPQGTPDTIKTSQVPVSSSQGQGSSSASQAGPSLSEDLCANSKVQPQAVSTCTPSARSLASPTPSIQSAASCSPSPSPVPVQQVQPLPVPRPLPHPGQLLQPQDASACSLQDASEPGGSHATSELQQVADPTPGHLSDGSLQPPCASCSPTAPASPLLSAHPASKEQPANGESHGQVASAPDAAPQPLVPSPGPSPSAPVLPQAAPPDDCSQLPSGLTQCQSAPSPDDALSEESLLMALLQEEQPGQSFHIARRASDEPLQGDQQKDGPCEQQLQIGRHQGMTDEAARPQPGRAAPSTSSAAGSTGSAAGSTGSAAGSTGTRGTTGWEGTAGSDGKKGEAQRYCPMTHNTAASSAAQTLLPLLPTLPPVPQLAQPPQQLRSQHEEQQPQALDSAAVGASALPAVGLSLHSTTPGCERGAWSGHPGLLMQHATAGSLPLIPIPIPVPCGPQPQQTSCQPASTSCQQHLPSSHSVPSPCFGPPQAPGPVATPREHYTHYLPPHLAMALGRPWGMSTSLLGQLMPQPLVSVSSSPAPGGGAAVPLVCAALASMGPSRGGLGSISSSSSSCGTSSSIMVMRAQGGAGAAPGPDAACTQGGQETCSLAGSTADGPSAIAGAISTAAGGEVDTCFLSHFMGWRDGSIRKAGVAHHSPPGSATHSTVQCGSSAHRQGHIRQECAVCFESLLTNARAVFQPCGHKECCVKCAAQVVAKFGTCPVCRNKVAGLVGLNVCK